MSCTEIGQDIHFKLLESEEHDAVCDTFQWFFVCSHHSKHMSVRVVFEAILLGVFGNVLCFDQLWCAALASVTDCPEWSHGLIARASAAHTTAAVVTECPREGHTYVPGIQQLPTCDNVHNCCTVTPSQTFSPNRNLNW